MTRTERDVLNHVANSYSDLHVVERRVMALVYLDVEDVGVLIS